MNTNFIPNKHKDLINRLFQQGEQLLPKIDISKTNLLHAAVGISGEAAELEAACLPLRQLQAFSDGAKNWYDAPADSPLDDQGDPVWPGLDFENLIEEMGDILFYEGAYRIAAGMEQIPVMLYRNQRVWWLSQTPQAAAKELGRKRVISMLISGLSCAAGKLLDYTKKHVMYNTELNLPGVYNALDDMAWCMNEMASILGVDEDFIREANTQKLNRRYPEGYSDLAATQRADKEGGTSHV